MACNGECVIQPLGYPGCYPPAIPDDVGRRVVRVSVPGLQGPKGETGELGYSTRTCADLSAFETKALENLRPERGAQPGDQVANSRGQLFFITDVTASTFTVGEVVGNVGVQIDDEDLSANSVWSSQKVQERIGAPVDFVKIFESELDGSEK